MKKSIRDWLDRARRNARRRGPTERDWWTVTLFQDGHVEVRDAGKQNARDFVDEYMSGGFGRFWLCTWRCAIKPDVSEEEIAARVSRAVAEDPECEPWDALFGAIASYGPGMCFSNDAN